MIPDPRKCIIWRNPPGLCSQRQFRVLMMRHTVKLVLGKREKENHLPYSSFFSSLFVVSGVTLDNAGEAEAEGGEPGWSPASARRL